MVLARTLRAPIYDLPGSRILRLAPIPVVLLGAIFLGTLVGSTHIPPEETLRILLYKLGIHAGPITWPASAVAIIWLIRLPEVIAAALVGAALGVAGALLQAVFRNPLADPYVIGTSAGAQLGIVAALLLPVSLAAAGFGTAQVFAFAGALLTILLVYALARVGGRVPVVTLLLAGFVVSSFLISGTSLLSVLSGNVDRLVAWTMGGITVDSWSQLAAIGPGTVVALALASAFAAKLDVLQLGEDQAGYLGLRVERLKLGVVVLASLLTALAVSMAGVVAFVGLIVPHAVRLIYGPGHRVLLPASAGFGAAFLILADLIARVAIPATELPLGVITAIVGAPFFLYLLRTSRSTYAL